MLNACAVFARGFGYFKPRAAVDLSDLLLRTHDFYVEVQVTEAVGQRLRGGDDFPSWLEAAKFGLVLEQEFGFTEAVRVASA